MDNSISPTELFNTVVSLSKQYGSPIVGRGARDIYYCPYCISKGEPSSKRTLYLYTDELDQPSNFHCFRCGTHINLRPGYSKDEVLKDRSYDTLSELLVKSLTKDKSPDIGLVDLTELSLAKDNPRIIEYLNNTRDGKYIDLLDELPIYSVTRLGRDGILFPLYLHGKTVGYQIRYLDDLPGKSRFYTSLGTKVPYRINLSDNVEEFTICEGIFSSLGSYKIGLPNPIAILGKDNIQMLGEMASRYPRINKIYLALDSHDLNLNLYDKISKSFKTTQFISVLFRDNLDPDGHYRKYGNKDVRYVNVLSKSLNNSLDKLVEASRSR